MALPTVMTLCFPDRSGGTSLSAHPSHPPGRRPEPGRGDQAVQQLMPARRELATSRFSWLAIIPTCLAKIGIVVPARGGCGLGGYFASKARHGGSRRGYRQSAAHGRLQFLEFGQ